MYITYKTIGENGRLGNQLFQYAAIKGLAAKLDYIPVLPFGIENRYWHGQKCLLYDLFDLDIKIKDINPDFTYNVKIKRGNIDDNDFFKCPPNTNLEGFPESEFYFRHIKDNIKKEFTIKDNVKDSAVNYINNFKKCGKQIIAIHIRRGDYIDDVASEGCNLEHCTETEWLLNYLKMAINKFDINSYKFLIFSGGSRFQNNLSDIEWCQYYFTKYFPNLDVSYSKNNTDSDDFIIFTLCDHAILTSLSTFGWWGSYLIQNENKQIYVPNIDIINNDNNYWNSSNNKYWADDFIIV